jgi:predicted Fe-Mo cluster-binding NifX family protein
VSFKAAVTSSDGVTIDLHFGRAEQFYIFSVDDGGAITLDGIKAVIREAGSGGHDPKSVQTVVDALGGCKYILTAKIGNKPHMLLQKAGITALESPPGIDAALSKLYKYHVKFTGDCRI